MMPEMEPARKRFLLRKRLCFLGTEEPPGAIECASDPSSFATYCKLVSTASCLDQCRLEKVDANPTLQ